VSFSIDNDVKDRIRTAVDIIDLVGSYVQLRRQGANFVGLCPFHEDRRPSFNVNPNRQTWKCWVCDKGGDVFSFLMEKERITFPEAIQMLAERSGIALAPSGLGNRREASSDYKKTLYEAMAWACSQYHQFLLKDPSSQMARAYLSDRGITAASIERYCIGYAPNSWSWLVDQGTAHGLKPEVLEAVGLLAKSEKGTRYDRFRGRVLFPIRDPQGRPIAVGGRVLPGAATDQAKYVNCNETRLYHKSHQLYGLDIAKETIHKNRTAVVMEGYTDVIMANQYGITNAVAVCGTALGESHIQLLRRYCDSVVLLLDGDEAGQRRTNEILELFIAAQLDLRVATLPDNLDPCDFLIERGADAMQAVLARTVDALEHKLSLVCRGFDPLIDTHRSNAALEQMLDLLAKAPKSSLLNNESARLRQEQILMRLSRQFGVESPSLRQRLERLREQVATRLRPRIETDRISSEGSQRVRDSSKTVDARGVAIVDVRVQEPPRAYRFSEMSGVELELFEILVLHPELIPFALERFPMAALLSETARALWQTYMDLELAGYALDFGSIMSATEDLTLKNVLVSLEQEATQKTEVIKLDADQRLHGLCDRLARQDQMLQEQHKVRALESKDLAANEEMDLLQQVIEQARTRQGLLPPKG
jgi:DNA primase